MVYENLQPNGSFEETVLDALKLITQSINAIGQRLDAMDQRIDAIGNRLDALTDSHHRFSEFATQRLAQMDSRFSTLDALVVRMNIDIAEIKARLTTPADRPPMGFVQSQPEPV